MHNPNGPTTTTFDKLFRHDLWNIGYVRAPIHAFLDGNFHPEIHWLPRPRPGRFAADPFGTIIDGRVHIMYEEYDYRLGRGYISCTELDANMNPLATRVAIDLPVHMSYPYLLEHDSTLYCIPETCAARSISIYRSEGTPFKWSQCGILIDNVAAADSTVFQHDGRWWLACTDNDIGPNSTLLFWHAPTPLGPWTPHSANPVKTDIGSSRPAGTPFTYEGDLYRPAQDCAGTYGGAIVINRVTRLTPNEFHEEPVRTLIPGTPYPHGLHTMSALGDITLIDAKRTTFVREAFIQMLKDKAGSMGWRPSRR